MRYALKRFLNAIPVLFIIITLSFFLMHAVPGGPFDADVNVPPEIQANLQAAYHLDQPLWVQYGLYLKNILKGDFGPSFKYQDYTVSQLILMSAPISLKLGASALGLAVIVGIFLGGYMALRSGRWSDRALENLTTLIISVPTFVTGPLLILLFAITLKWAPVSGWGEKPSQFVLPLLTLFLPLTAYITRITRGALLEVLSQPFILFAQAKGLRRQQILWKHALKPALIPVVSFLGPAAAGILTGSVIVEKIFSIPGLGRYFVYGALNRDYTLVMGMVIFYGVLIIFFNLIVDILYGFLNPRVRRQSQ